ncbi:helix-turn-helix transcriptional regulator [Streptomyces sp. NPDC094472]|uniref:helix-turn-helix domain-containing protein n=1 Tax=unclassified Streptomyces TaxID=2593676 RepID=UPI00332450B2
MPFQPRELFPDRSARDLFGAEIRRHREKADMSLRRLSEVLNYSKSHLARIEAAESLPYDDLPAKLDACATIPGLLQTPELAKASLRIGNRFAPDAEIEAWANARIARQARLAEPRPPHCWFIVDEAALRRAAGGPEVMRRQLVSLLERGTQPYVTIQVLPFRAGQHVEAGGSLLLYTLPNEPLLAYEEAAASGLSSRTWAGSRSVGRTTICSGPWPSRPSTPRR